jgi:hypothetical protein
MGAARVRKLNGTYPTRDQIAVRPQPAPQPSKRFRFDMRRVPPVRRTSETLRDMIWEYTLKLQDKEWKRGLCIHESAHAIFAEGFGADTEFEVQFAFSYDNLDDSFNCEQACVVHQELEWLEDVVVSLAGPVAEQVLTSKASKADSYSDYQEVNEILRQQGMLAVQRPAFIKQIEWQIRAQLQQLEIRDVILERADEYERILEDAISQMSL